MDLQSDTVTKTQAQELLTQSIGPDAEFRPQQWAAIDGLVNDGDRLLLVQRTGWGKSTVYFISTRLLRDRGAGPTLIISPLLALMHNQIRDAEQQLDLEARTINSNNTEDWAETKQAILDGTCDLLLISPERLANREFQEEVLMEMDEEFGMLVVDEAHCISDWGHDFRPDYRRIKRILQQLPDHIPVAATTATANDRVVDDITTQVPNLRAIRGDLVRESLRIQTITIDSRAKRLAWLAENIADQPTAGIVYCLTTDEVETVADWLSSRGLNVAPYHGGMEGEHRRDLEDRLLANDVDALVATNALGMGFNKPDLGWVIHFQRPPNLIRYYQEIGRAGRSLDEAFAVMLTGPEDDEIAEFFIEAAFPDPADFQSVLEVLEASESPLYKYEILKRTDISWKAASQCLDILRVENAVIRVDDGFERTGGEWQYDHDRIESVTELRWEELERIQTFAETDACLTRFIDDELDGSLETDCGRCANCTGAFLPTAVRDEELITAATEHYRAESWEEISARYYLPERGGGRSTIPTEQRPEDGRVLSVYGDPGWGALVRDQLDGNGSFSQELVDAAVRHVGTRWAPSPEPAWVTAVPSYRGDTQVRDMARRIADGLELPFVDALAQVEPTVPQRELANSYQQRWNVEGVFDAREKVRAGPVLLVDDTVGSRWTLTEAAMTLRSHGSGVVYPFALAKRTRW